jgi:hypothetical protein
MLSESLVLESEFYYSLQRIWFIPTLRTGHLFCLGPVYVILNWSSILLILGPVNSKPEACSAERALAIARVPSPLNGSVRYIAQKRAHANNRERSLC